MADDRTPEIDMPESDIQFLARVLRLHVAGDQVTRRQLDRLDAIIRYGHGHVPLGPEGTG